MIKMVDSIFLFFYCFIYTFPILQTLQIWALKMSHANFLFYTKLFLWSRKCNLCTLTLVTRNIDLDTKWPKLSNNFFTISCTLSRCTIFSTGNSNCILQFIYLFWSLLEKTLLDDCILIPDVQCSFVFQSPMKIDGCHNHLVYISQIFLIYRIAIDTI